MAEYQIAWKASTKTATVQALGDVLPSGAVKLGEFEYSEGDPEVFFHHVQDALYREGYWNMSIIRIDHDTTYVALVSFVLAPGTVNLAPGGTQQLTVTPTPGGATNTAIATWVSSDPTKATVSASGLVTAVADGTTTITATSVDGALTATRLVTVATP